jgi:hypothetical protein
MTYKKQLHPWSIVRSLAGGQKISVGRFRRYNDASSHLQCLRQMSPNLDHAIVFDPMDRLHADSEDNLVEMGADAPEPVGDRHEQSEPTTNQTNKPEVEFASTGASTNSMYKSAKSAKAPKPKTHLHVEAEPELAPGQSIQKRSAGGLRLVD